MAQIKLAQFAVSTGSTETVAAVYHEHALAAMERFQIQEPPQIAAFCATLGIESAYLTQMEEGLYYKDAKRLCMLFRRVFDLDKDKVIDPEEIAYAEQFVRKPEKLSQVLYAGYHGRGGIQLTWEKNYRLHGDKLGFNYVLNPKMLTEPMHAMLSAASYIDEVKGNSVADNMDEYTLRVNGPARLHLAERIALRNKALQVL